MVATLTVRDETADGRPAHEWRLDLPAERVTVRDVLLGRVRREAQEYDRRRPHAYRGLVQPPAGERGPAGSGKPAAPTDWQKQFDLAAAAFAAGRLLILVGDAQAVSLDDEFEIRRGTAVTFLRLTPLVGG